MLSPERLLNPQQINLYAYAVNNPLYYYDPSGEIPVRLGKQSESELQGQIDSIIQQLSDNPYQDDLWERLDSLNTQLSAVKEGNEVIGAWLDQLKESGEDKGLQLSDFILTTEPDKDLTEAATKAGKSEATIADGRKDWSTPNLVGIVIGGEIYLLQTSRVYQRTKAGGEKGTTVGDISKEDNDRLGGSWLRHEDYHKSAKDLSEYNAYSHQEKVLDNMNKSKNAFTNQEFFKLIKTGIQNRIQQDKQREGIK